MNIIVIEKIYKFLKKYYRWILGTLFLVLLFINILIFYQYVYLTIKKEPAFIKHQLSIDGQALQRILDNIQEREDSLDKVLKNQYPDIFSP